MKVLLGIPSYGGRSGDIVDIDEHLAADLISGGNATAVVEPAPEVPVVVAAPVVVADPAPVVDEKPARRGRLDPPTE